VVSPKSCRERHEADSVKDEPQGCRGCPSPSGYPTWFLEGGVVYEIYACDNCLRRFRTLNIPAERSPEALRKRIKGARSVAEILRLSPPELHSQAAESFLSVMRELDREETLKQDVIDELWKRERRPSSRTRRRKLDMSKYWPLLQKAGLTDRQIECMLLNLEGLAGATIAKTLRLHHSTVQEHIKVAKKKLKNSPSLIKALGISVRPRN
jgi:hypothetical protein